MTFSSDFNSFLDDLRSTHGENLVSVMIYGSAAKFENPKKEDVRMVIALETISPDDLRKAHAAMREWTKVGYEAPTYFTANEMATSADVFPIEFHHMTRARRVLWGRDLLADVTVGNANLRHQIEFDLRSKLIKLRREYIAASNSAQKLGELMAASLPSFVSTFRALILLKGEEPPIARPDTVRKLGAICGVDFEPFEKIFSIRENGIIPGFDEGKANGLFADYLIEIEKVIKAVDSIG